MMNATEKQEEQFKKGFFLVTLLIIGALLLFSLKEFFTSFLGSVALYVIAKPSIDFLMKKGRSKSAIATFIIIVSFFVILVPIGLLALLLYNKLVWITQNPQAIVLPIEQTVQRLQTKFNFQILSADNIKSFQKVATNLVTGIVNGSFSFFSNIIMLYFFFYFLVQNTNKMEEKLLHYLPFKKSKNSLFGEELQSQTYSNAIGIPLIAVLHGILAYIGYLIAGLPEAGFWAILTGFASIIPIVGTGLIWLPASIYLLVMEHYWQGSFLLGWGMIVIGLSDNLIRFWLAKKMADVHPVITVLGVLMGLKYFGITGLIFGPLTISYFLILIRIYAENYLSQKNITDKEQKLPS
ncbi:MAG: AI-2E family transporter [Chitinophagaceae bacterium]